MDNVLKTIDEIGEETESYISLTHGQGICKLVRFTPSTSKSNQDYIITQSDYQTKRLFIPPPPLNGYWSGITKADGNHCNHRSCFYPIPIFTFLKQSPSASPPYNYLMLHEMLHVTSKRVNPNVTFFSNFYINLPN